MKISQPAVRVVLTDLEFLRSVFSMDSLVRKEGGMIQFIINNNRKDELAFEEWRINFGYSMKGCTPPVHENGVSWYWVRKKLE